KYLWFEKIKAPLKPLYWFLISKGYKTYLLMANNFSRHYPRLEEPTPAYYKKIMDEFYSMKFKTLYKSDQGLIIPEGPSCHLKENVADITETQLKVPRIAFFQRSNPNWKDGTELACVAEMTLLMPIKYALKKMWKGFFK